MSAARLKEFDSNDRFISLLPFSHAMGLTANLLLPLYAGSAIVTPKVLAASGEPAEWPANPRLEWNPPGHGEFYAALEFSGTLQKLLDAGICYLFVSNSDNLGATLSPEVLGYMAAEGVPFLMEVTRRTRGDRKGGHLAVAADGRLTLRESAQCHPDDVPHFQDIERHRYFNTNNLWIDLEALAARIGPDQPLVLPLIRNQKTVDPRDPSSTPVFQLESAMGSAIADLTTRG